MSLTPKQQRFVEEYLIDFNAKQAAIRAGYSVNSAEQQGCRLLRNVKVTKAIQGGQKVISALALVKAEEVVRAAWNVADFDPIDLFDDECNPLPLDQVPEHARKAVQEFSVTTIKSGDFEETTVTRYRLSDRLRANDQLMKHLGLYASGVPKKNELPSDVPLDEIGQILARRLKAAGVKL